MKIACPTCGTNANLPDEKIPKDKDFSFKCPKCGSSVPVRAAEIAGEKSGKGTGKTPGKPAPVTDTPAADPGIPGFQTSGEKQALICIPPGPVRDRIEGGVKNAGLKAHIAEIPDQALKNLEYYVYPLVLVDDAFDKDEAVIACMNSMDMSLRRKICLVRVGPELETGNAMMALTLSANYVIKSRDIEVIDATLISDILGTALSEHEQMYAVFNDSMKAVGKA